MASNLTYPLTVSDKLTLYRHPERKAFYKKSELAVSNTLFGTPLLQEGWGKKEHAILLDRLEYELLKQWETNPTAHKMLERSLNWLKPKHPLSVLRADGTPRIFHFIEPAFKLSHMHADADTIIATLHHDDFEDGFSTPSELFSILCGKNPDRQTQILAHAAMYHVDVLTNIPQTKTARVKMYKPADWKNPQVLAYLEDRMSIEREYMRVLSSRPLSDALVIKVCGDRLNNGQSFFDARRDINLMTSRYLKDFIGLDWSKKIHYATRYYTIQLIEQGLEKIDAHFDGARTAFRVPQKKDVDIPIDLFFNLDYHKLSQSFEQDAHEENIVEIAGIRSKLSGETLSQLPYSGSKVAVIFCPQKSEYMRIDHHPFEIQLPRRLGFGDPGQTQGWNQLDPRSIIKELQNILNSETSGNPRLGDFEAHPIPTLLPGKIGIDSMMVRLVYLKGSLRHYLESSKKGPVLAYDELTKKLRYVLCEFMDNKFLRMVPPSVDEPVPEHIKDRLFKQIKAKLDESFPQ